MKTIGKNISPNWSSVEKRPPWGTVTSRELSKILGVSLQTINNWKMRDILPAPEPSHKHKGNVNRYRICKVRAWLEDKDDGQIQWDWINEYMDCGRPFASLKQAQEVARIGWEALEIERVV